MNRYFFNKGSSWLALALSASSLLRRHWPFAPRSSAAFPHGAPFSAFPLRGLWKHRCLPAQEPHVSLFRERDGPLQVSVKNIKYLA